MTLATERSRMGREPFIMVELVLDACSLTFGQAPCAAISDKKCFNTYGTCQDKQNFAKVSKTYTFSDILLPANANSIPCLKSASYAPTRIDPAKGLGTRASVTITLQDFSHSDVGTDPYFLTRPYKAANQGTFFGKFMARNRFYQGRTMYVTSGFLDANGAFSTVNATRSMYVIEKIEGPDAKGNVKITGKDVLKLIDDERATIPAATAGLLTSAVAASGNGTFTVTAGKESEYGAGGFLALDKEIVGYTRVGTTFTITSRAQYFTLAEAHDIGNKVQDCYAVTTPTRVDAIIYNLLTLNASISSSYIDVFEWVAEANVWLADALFTGIIVKPTGINKIVTELAQQGCCYIWWDDQLQKIKLQAIRPATYYEVTSLDDDISFLMDTTSLTEKPDERVSQVWVYYGIKNPFDDTKTENYRGLSATADLEAESAIEYGEQRIRSIVSRWLPNTAVNQAAIIGTRHLDKYRNNPRYLKAQVDAKDSGIRPGSIVRVKCSRIQNVYGESNSINMQVVEMKEVLAGTKFEMILTDVYFSGRYANITPDYAPVYELATTEQRGTMAFICIDTGLMSDGEEGYKIV